MVTNLAGWSAFDSCSFVKIRGQNHAKSADAGLGNLGPSFRKLRTTNGHEWARIQPDETRVIRDGMKSVGAPRIVASMSKSGRVCASEPAGACNTRGWPEGNRGSRMSMGFLPVSVIEPVGEKGTFVGVVEPRMPECHLSRPLPPKPGHATGLPHKSTP